MRHIYKTVNVTFTKYLLQRIFMVHALSLPGTINNVNCFKNMPFMSQPANSWLVAMSIYSALYLVQ